MQEDESPLESIRSRSLLYSSYIIWFITAAAVLFALSAYVSAVQSWLGTVERFRRYLGFTPPPNSQDWWLVSATVLALLLPIGIALAVFVAYRRDWRRRLTLIWGEGGGGSAQRIWKLTTMADATEVRRRCEYLKSLVGTERWRSSRIDVPTLSADSYRSAAELVLAEIEADIAQRAIMLGFVVGLSRKSLMDFVAISTAALELQLHVLTSLGKWPSPNTWIRLWKRTLSSLFFSWYLNAEQSLTFRLMIRKIGLGLEAGSAALEHAGSALMHSAHPDDVDWDDIEHLLPDGFSVRALATAAGIAAGTTISVGAFGMNQIGRFIEQRGEDLFQGALAASILYGHGVALAADCIALDTSHRESPVLQPPFCDVMTRMSRHAGIMLGDQVRSLRGVLRERRRLIWKIAREKSTAAGASVKTTVTEVAAGAATATSAAMGKAKDATKSLVDMARGRRSRGGVITPLGTDKKPEAAES